MSSALRLSIIMVLLLATTAFGLIAYNMNLPKVQVPVAEVHGEGARDASDCRIFCRGTSAAERDIGPRRRFHGTLGAAGSCSSRGDPRNARRPRPVFPVRWFASSSTPAVPSRWKTSCGREIAVFSPASWRRTAVPSASRLTRSLASRA